MSYHILADYDIMSTLGDDLSFTTIHYHEITTSTYIYIYMEIGFSKWGVRKIIQAWCRYCQCDTHWFWGTYII